MKTLLSGIAGAMLVVTGGTLPAQTYSYTDAVNDIDPGIATAAGTADILATEVTMSPTDLAFKLTVNGNVATTDWAKFMIGISTGKTAGTTATNGNGWGRPINMISPVGGMNFWVGSWVDGGGGAQFWAYDDLGGSWSEIGSTGGGTFPGTFSITSGATSEINYTLDPTLMDLGPSDTWYFDIYSSGGGGGDSSIDALSNPNIAITSWGGPYTSNVTNGISVVPEPASLAALASATGAGVAWHLFRKRRQRQGSAVA
jgi:hypothetical protein